MCTSQEAEMSSAQNAALADFDRLLAKHDGGGKLKRPPVALIFNICVATDWESNPLRFCPSELFHLIDSLHPVTLYAMH